MLTSRHKLGIEAPSNPLLQLLPHNSLKWHAEVLKLINNFLSYSTERRRLAVTAWLRYSYSMKSFSGNFLPPTLLSASYIPQPHWMRPSQAAPCFSSECLSDSALCQASSSEQHPGSSRAFCAPDQPPPSVWSQHLIENWILVVACDDNEPFMSQFEKAFETPVFISNYR